MVRIIHCNGIEKAIDRAAQRGEIGPGVASSVVAEAGAAIVVQRWLLTGTAIDEELVTAVVDEVVLPLLSGSGYTDAS